MADSEKQPSSSGRMGRLVVTDVDEILSSSVQGENGHHVAPRFSAAFVVPQILEGKDSDLVFDPLLREDTGGSSKAIFNNTDKQLVHMRFNDLRYEVDVGKGKQKTAKQILKGIDGEARPGHVLAIMGASGAGKTTLLNLLAGRLSQAGNGRTSGSILVNGEKRDFRTFRHASAYVLQDDSFFAELTVQETIMLSALLRLPAAMTQEEKEQRVREVIAELGLTKCQDTFVGNELIRGVSGGERKRVNIGTELVTDPSLIFLDEPTTGLDSFNAQNVMSTLLDLAHNGRTIVTTIHQPRSTIYQMFDDLMLLSEGHVLYFGRAKEATTYFRKLGYACPDGFNPSDYFLDLISYDQRSKELEEKTKRRIDFLVDKYNDYRKEQPIEYEKHTGGVRSPFEDLESGKAASKYATSFFTQFWLLSQRSFKIMLREKANNIAQAGQILFFAIILGCIWLNEGGDESGSKIQSIAGSLFFILVNQSFTGIFSIIFLFPSERTIVLKERAARSYNVGAYFWSKSMAELPRIFILNLLFAIVTFFMIDYRPGADHFFLYVVIIFLTMQCAEGVAYCVSALAKDPQQAGAIAPVFIVMSLLFGGFFIGTDNIPVWLGWLQWLSFLQYGFSAAMQNEYEDRILDTSACGDGFNSTASANVTGTTCAPSSSSDVFCPPSGNAVLDFYEVDDLSLAANIGVLIGLAFGLRFIAYLILRRNGPVYDTSI